MNHATWRWGLKHVPLAARSTTPPYVPLIQMYREFANRGNDLRMCEHHQLLLVGSSYGNAALIGCFVLFHIVTRIKACMPFYARTLIHESSNRLPVLLLYPSTQAIPFRESAICLKNQMARLASRLAASLRMPFPILPMTTLQMMQTFRRDIKMLCSPIK